MRNAETENAKWYKQNWFLYVLLSVFIGLLVYLLFFMPVDDDKSIEEQFHQNVKIGAQQKLRENPEIGIKTSAYTAGFYSKEQIAELDAIQSFFEDFFDLLSGGQYEAAYAYIENKEKLGFVEFENYWSSVIDGEVFAKVINHEINEAGDIIALFKVKSSHVGDEGDNGNFEMIIMIDLHIIDGEVLLNYEVL